VRAVTPGHGLAPRTLFTIDHFYAKLFKTAASMQTAAGKQEASRRVEVMRRYLAELGEEI
jgi:uncharacterized protein